MNSGWQGPTASWPRHACYYSSRQVVSLSSNALLTSKPCKMLVSRQGPIVLNRVQCKLCPKSFRRPDHLKRHERNHEAPRFPCMFPGCGHRFHRRDVLTRHSTSHDWDRYAFEAYRSRHRMAVPTGLLMCHRSLRSRIHISLIHLVR